MNIPAPSKIASCSIPFLLGLSLLTWYFAPLAWLPAASVPSAWPTGWVGPWSVWLMGSQCHLWSSSPYATGQVLAPLGAHLYSMPLAEAFVLPARCLARGVATTELYSFLCLIAFVLNYSTAFALFRMLAQHGWIALVLAIAFTFHPYFTEHLRGGDLGALCVFPLLLYVHLLISCLEDFKRAPQLQPALGALLVVLAFSDVYYLFFAGIITILLAAVLVWSKRVGGNWFFRLVATPFIAALGLGSIKLVPLVRDALDVEHALWRSNPLLLSADIVSLLIPGPSQLLGSWWPLAPHNVIVISEQVETGTYLGWSLLIGVVLSMWCYRRATVRHPLIVALPWLALLMIVLSLGPAVQWQGHILAHNPFFTMLAHGLPIVPGIPARFAMIAVLLLFILLALQLPGLVTQPEFFGERRRWIMGALVVFALVEYFPVPLRFSTFHWTPAITELQRSSVTTVLDLDDHVNAALARQIFHAKNLVGGPRAVVEGNQGAALRDNFFLSWVNEGIVANAGLIQRDFAALDAGAILIPTRMVAQMNRLKNFDRVMPVINDGEFALYSVR